MLSPFETLKQDGFVMIRNVLEPKAADGARAAADAILRNDSLKIQDYVGYRDSGTWACGVRESDGIRVAIDALGADPRIDDAVERVLSHPVVQEVLQTALGKGLRLTQVTLREARAGDEPLNYHQDTASEMGIGVLLADCPSKEGTTTFIKRSHRLPFTIRELLFYPRLDTRVVPGALESAGTGKAGDVYIFFNRTWHCRHRLRHADSQCAILMSFFPSGARHKYRAIREPLRGRLGSTVQRLTVEDDTLKISEKGFATYHGTGPEDREVRQLLQLDAFQFNRPFRVLASPLLAVTGVLGRLTGRAR